MAYWVVGPRVKALAHILHYLHGVPVRKTAAILKDLTGIRLTRGAITQHALQQAGGPQSGRAKERARPPFRGSLLRFLGEHGVDPTNNRAERDLRPAVIARKVSHCSKNPNGAKAFEAFTSVLQAIRKTQPSALAASVTALIRPSPSSG